MKPLSRLNKDRGFTLVELCVVIVVLGLILSMMGLEFYGVVSNVLHTRANTDSESMSRVAMAKVSNEMRRAFPDITDFSKPPAPVIQPAGTPGPVAEFWAVHQGSLGQPIKVCGLPNVGAPCPPYDDILIQINPKVPGELDEIVTPFGGKPPPLPLVLARHVTGFTVTPNGTEYDISITVTTPSTHCVSNGCSFTLNNVVYVGGFGSE